MQQALAIPDQIHRLKHEPPLNVLVAQTDGVAPMLSMHGE
jgi:hypothetical protein